MTVGIFYALPALQLVFSEQRVRMTRLLSQASALTGREWSAPKHHSTPRVVSLTESEL